MFIFFNYSSFLLFCCFFIFLHENLHPGQGEPNSRTLPPCPKEKLSTLLFSNFFQFGESFTRGERLENLSLIKWKIGRPKTQGGVLFKEGRSEVLPKGLHRRAQTLPRQQWIRCTFLDWLYTIFNRCFLFFFSSFLLFFFLLYSIP